MKKNQIIWHRLDNLMYNIKQCAEKITHMNIAGLSPSDMEATPAQLAHLRGGTRNAGPLDA
ncbi:hypothetical protein KDI_27550 [Dictyobacter arantiisoli]|uniref:Uncharacterized protein n=1 Tax=Dictyobacter arantiisoli TaxID=2014874 RepID=A0A5A5TCF0_9CHLR|nr:hypothetical protein KDI_27550 [Dictyobacter arantiisoli]